MDILALSAIVIAVIAFALERRTARQLAHLTQMYWQLKYDFGELKARIDPPPPSSGPQQTFVPLSALTTTKKAK